MKTRYKYIHFKKLTDDLRKKPYYDCLNNKSKARLAQVIFYHIWNRWCFLTTERGMVFDTSCLADIIDFMEQLNVEDKNEPT